MRLRAHSFVFAGLTLTLLSGPSPATAAAPYYVYRGEKVALDLDATRVLVRMREGAADAGEAVRAWAGGDAGTMEPVGFGGWTLLDAASAAADRSGSRGMTTNEATAALARVESGVRSLLANDDVEFASPVFRLTDGGWAAVTPHVLLRLHDDDDAGVLAAIANEALVEDVAFGSIPNAYRLRCSSRDGFEVLDLANRLAGDARVAWAEPDMLFSGRAMVAGVTAAEIPPLALGVEDPLYTQQWALENTGQFGGVPDVDLDVNEAWSIETGRANVRVLVLDVGVQQDHPDLNLVPGADFTNEGFRGAPSNLCDNHGTPVAGCISGIRGNGIGVAGIAPGCPVLSARIGVSASNCDLGWSGPISATVYALAWGFVNGARVSNNSNGYGFTSNAIDAAYASTHDGGMIHFGAAGNGGPQPLGYPASIPEVLAVGAIAPDGSLASFSNYGPDVELMAPGVLVWTTDRTGSTGWVDGDYVLTAGTSFSAPCAAAVAALIVSQDTTRSAAEVEQLLFQGCSDFGDPGRDSVYGYGVVNAYTSLTLGVAPAVGVDAVRGVLALAPPLPNPFSNSTELTFVLDRDQAVTLDVFDPLGRRIRRLRDESLRAGRHVVSWNGRGEDGEEVRPGLYFARLGMEGSVAVHRVVFAR